MPTPVVTHGTRALTPADLTALERAHACLRPRAVAVTLSTGYAEHPEVAEVSWQGDCSRTRWVISREGSAVLLDELDGAATPFLSIQAAVEAIVNTLDAEQQEAAAAIPAVLQRH